MVVADGFSSLCGGIRGVYHLAFFCPDIFNAYSLLIIGLLFQAYPMRYLAYSKGCSSMEYTPKDFSSLWSLRERKASFPDPSAVVAAALTEIQSDGSIFCYDEVFQSWTRWEPRRPMKFDEQSPERYATELGQVAVCIEGTVSVLATASGHPEMVERHIKGLAHVLTAYLSSPAFIQYAASLVKVDKKGHLLATEMQFPDGSPSEWVPLLQNEIENQNKMLMM
jgi:hypothetical protein